MPPYVRFSGILACLHLVVVLKPRARGEGERGMLTVTGCRDNRHRNGGWSAHLQCKFAHAKKFKRVSLTYNNIYKLYTNTLHYSTTKCSCSFHIYIFICGLLTYKHIIHIALYIANPCENRVEHVFRFIAQTHSEIM